MTTAVFALTAAAPAHGAEHRIERNRENQVVRVRLPAHRRVVALSFDDGPNPQYTPAILRMLAKYHDRATFFMEGQFVQQWPDVARSVAAQGHEVANHTWDHPDIRHLHRAALVQQLERTTAAFAAAGLPRPTLFRPPKGASNAEDDLAVRSTGMTTAGWTAGLCVEKYIRNRTPGAAMRAMVARARPGDILLAHDGGIPSRNATLQALPVLLAGLRARGYKVVTVGELLRLARS
jgi:peptidoglycan/xylan/chitin deacetylase (PgdA/CDA1 family)